MALITSKDNPHILRFTALRDNRSRRREEGSFVVEGLRLCEESASAPGVELDALLFTTTALERFGSAIGAFERKAHRSLLITDGLGRKISDTKSPQGVFAICRLLDKSTELATIENGGRYLLLENVQDPGNLGTILRTADAFGIDGIVVTEGSCDLYNPKVLRATMGSVFRIPVAVDASASTAAQAFRQAGVPLFAAVAEDAAPVASCDFLQGGAVCIGNEGNGLSDALIALCDRRITIPMRGGAESLNAAMAAGIFMWEMARSR